MDSGGYSQAAYEKRFTSSSIDRVEMIAPYLSGVKITNKEDLERQHAVLEAFCNKNGWRTEIIRDLGSGMNYNKKGLLRLLELLVRGQMSRLVITHKDRLLRFGAEILFRICELKGIEVVIINKGEQPQLRFVDRQRPQRCDQSVSRLTLSPSPRVARRR